MPLSLHRWGEIWHGVVDLWSTSSVQRVTPAAAEQKISELPFE